MDELTKDEFENWKSQIVISNSDMMGLRKIPYAFTEEGIYMLPSTGSGTGFILIIEHSRNSGIDKKEV